MKFIHLCYWATWLPYSNYANKLSYASVDAYDSDYAPENRSLNNRGRISLQTFTWQHDVSTAIHGELNKQSDRVVCYGKLAEILKLSKHSRR